MIFHRRGLKGENAAGFNANLVPSGTPALNGVSSSKAIEFRTPWNKFGNSGNFMMVNPTSLVLAGDYLGRLISI